ncbi:GH24 family phage-related lysozyme (muramidase) [Altererythrobacter atlanticus]|uniref:Lysozyme n=1 Tax=Croceibacterium atlanticum TaxID=1267766 RepID=A0A0F7KTF4_9SPHN|nr:lysozyme [Croceibacterium atlanticum]AKH42416.1 Lysozyme RrrD [Croceibacterium atlanticum]MBB5731193.1 GH24 family phage-related lysozyme (muramidase) [Croceibacterium atlanticum]
MQRKPIFDTFRQLLGRGFHPAEVAAIDASIDTAMAPDDPDPLPHSAGPAGIALINQFESCARLRPDGTVEAYPDPGTGGAPWTIGWGATGPDIGPGTIWTRAQCDKRLEDDLRRFAADIRRAVGDAPTTQAQFDALLSFHYNTGAIGRATLTRRHIAGDHEGAAREFARWTLAGGRVLRGLVRRREAEAALYRSG